MNEVSVDDILGGSFDEFEIVGLVPVSMQLQDVVGDVISYDSIDTTEGLLIRLPETMTYVRMVIVTTAGDYGIDIGV